jgi:hypothetical protein
MFLEKLCVSCKVNKSISEYNKDSRAYDGLCCYCKTCKKQKKKEQYNKNKQKILLKQKQYVQKNKQLIKERAASYRVKNRENKNKKDLEYYYANKELILLKAKERYKKNKNKIKAKVKKYTELNKAKVTAIKAKYRAAKYQATPKWLTKEHLDEIKSFYELARELAWLNEGQVLQVDHIIPLQGKDVCGLHVPWNLQLLNKSNNISKFNNIIDINN